MAPNRTWLAIDVDETCDALGDTHLGASGFAKTYVIGLGDWARLQARLEVFRRIAEVDLHPTVADLGSAGGASAYYWGTTRVLVGDRGAISESEPIALFDTLFQRHQKGR